MGIADCAFCGHARAEHGNFARLHAINPTVRTSDYSADQCFGEVVSVSIRVHTHYEFWPAVRCPCHEYIDPLEKLARRIADLVRRDVP